MTRPAKGRYSVKMRLKIVRMTRERGRCTGVFSAYTALNSNLCEQTSQRSLLECLSHWFKQSSWQSWIEPEHLHGLRSGRPLSAGHRHTLHSFSSTESSSSITSFSAAAAPSASSGDAIMLSLQQNGSLRNTPREKHAPSNTKEKHAPSTDGRCIEGEIRRSMMRPFNLLWIPKLVQKNPISNFFGLRMGPFAAPFTPFGSI